MLYSPLCFCWCTRCLDFRPLHLDDSSPWGMFNEGMGLAALTSFRPNTSNVWTWYCILHLHQAKNGRKLRDPPRRSATATFDLLPRCISKLNGMPIFVKRGCLADVRAQMQGLSMRCEQAC